MTDLPPVKKNTPPDRGWHPSGVAFVAIVLTVCIPLATLLTRLALGL